MESNTKPTPRIADAAGKPLGVVKSNPAAQIFRKVSTSTSEVMDSALAMAFAQALLANPAKPKTSQ